jgi:hypothetical protein
MTSSCARPPLFIPRHASRSLLRSRGGTKMQSTLHARSKRTDSMN